MFVTTSVLLEARLEAGHDVGDVVQRVGHEARRRRERGVRARHAQQRRQRAQQRVQQHRHRPRHRDLPLPPHTLRIICRREIRLIKVQLSPKENSSSEPMEVDGFFMIRPVEFFDKMIFQ